MFIIDDSVEGVWAIWYRDDHDDYGWVHVEDCDTEREAADEVWLLKSQIERTI